MLKWVVAKKQIIIVEDNEGDKVLLCQALKKAGLSFEFRWISDGLAAATVLAEANVSADIIFLDVSLPGRSGWDVLDRIDNNPALAKAKVVLLSGSDSAFDVARAQNMGKMFFKKPMEFSSYQAIASAVAGI